MTEQEFVVTRNQAFTGLDARWTEMEGLCGLQRDGGPPGSPGGGTRCPSLEPSRARLYPLTFEIERAR